MIQRFLGPFVFQVWKYPNLVCAISDISKKSKWTIQQPTESANPFSIPLQRSPLFWINLKWVFPYIALCFYHKCVDSKATYEIALHRFNLHVNSIRSFVPSWLAFLAQVILWKPSTLAPVTPLNPQHSFFYEHPLWFPHALCEGVSEMCLEVGLWGREAGFNFPTPSSAI